jgi:hypothetical protein
MSIFITTWLLMAATAVACGSQLCFVPALTVWAGLVAALCAGGAALISHQPVGVATTGGRLGFSFVHWGFRVGRGRLIPAIGVSWIIWLVLGSATIGATQFPEHLPIIASWTGDGIALLYLLGVIMSRTSGGRTPGSLINGVFIILGLIGGSVFLWFHTGTDGARALAVGFAGGPPLFVGVGYGFVLAMDLLAGRRGRRN